jgi:hypothetical protein
MLILMERVDENLEKGKYMRRTILTMIFALAIFNNTYGVWHGGSFQP